MCDGADAINYIIDNSIDGVIIECGVADAWFELTCIRELQKRNITRDIYCYDTFAGLTKPGIYDYTCEFSPIYKMTNKEVQDRWENDIISDKANNWCYYPLELVKNSLESTGYPKDKIHYVVGDVLETLKNVNNIPEKIAILRLDTDWYDSSKFELMQMYNNVVEGGLIIFDDYYHWDGQRRATDEYFASINKEYNFVNVGNGKTAAIIKK
jgi:hypothetical protein